MIARFLALVALATTVLISGCAVIPMGGYQVTGTASVPISVGGQRGGIVVGGATGGQQVQQGQQRVVYVDHLGQVVGQAGSAGQPVVVVINHNGNNGNNGNNSSNNTQGRRICPLGYQILRYQDGSPRECEQSTSTGYRRVIPLWSE